MSLLGKASAVPAAAGIVIYGLTVPAFKWLTVWGFFLGLIENFLYGVYAGLVFVRIYNFFTRQWGV